MAATGPRWRGTAPRRPPDPRHRPGPTVTDRPGIGLPRCRRGRARSRGSGGPTACTATASGRGVADRTAPGRHRHRSPGSAGATDRRRAARHRRLARVVGTSTWRSTAVLTGHSDSVFALAFSADGETLITGSGDRTLASSPPRASSDGCGASTQGRSLGTSAGSAPHTTGLSCWPTLLAGRVPAGPDGDPHDRAACSGSSAAPSTGRAGHQVGPASAQWYRHAQGCGAAVDRSALVAAGRRVRGVEVVVSDPPVPGGAVHPDVPPGTDSAHGRPRGPAVQIDAVAVVQLAGGGAGGVRARADVDAVADQPRRAAALVAVRVTAAEGRGRRRSRPEAAAAGTAVANGTAISPAAPAATATLRSHLLMSFPPPCPCWTPCPSFAARQGLSR